MPEGTPTDELRCPACDRGIGPREPVAFERGRTLHIECWRAGAATTGSPRPRLAGAERQRLVQTCAQHWIATCPRCGSAMRLKELDVDVLHPTRLFACGLCKHDLTLFVVEHFVTCEAIRRQTARDAAAEQQEASRALRDRADILIQESEALREETRHLIQDYRQRPPAPPAGPPAADPSAGE